MTENLKRYEAPTLTRYGSVKALTAGYTLIAPTGASYDKETGGSDSFAQCMGYPGDPACGCDQ